MGNQAVDIQSFEKWAGGRYVDSKTNRTLKEVAFFLDGLNVQHYPKDKSLGFFQSFLSSLGPYADSIDGHVGYNENTLFYQKDFIMRDGSLMDDGRIYQLRLLVHFYTVLCNRHPEVGYFNKSVRLSYKLLQNKMLPVYFLEGWVFLNYSPFMKYEGQERIIFTLHGFDRHSTRMTSKDYYQLPIYKIRSQFFRRLFFDYMKSSYKRFIACSAISVGSIDDVLNAICDIKARGISSVSDESHWTVLEARILRKLIDESKTTVFSKNKGENISIRTKNNRIGFMRRWFQWAADNGYMTFEKLFFDEFEQFEEPAKKDARPIPKEHLPLVFEKARELSTESDKNRILYLSMKFIHQTNFRPSDVFSLSLFKLGFSIVKGSRIIQHITKTSGPRGQVDPLTKYDYALLKEVIEITQDLRDNAPDISLKDKFFLYRNKRGQIVAADTGTLCDFMRRVCDKLGIKRYAPYNIRYTYMTKVFESAVINDLSEAEVRVLTKHVKLGTTMGYVAKSRIDYFKALYQVMLEDVQVDPHGKVVDKMPEQSQDLGEREGGCGKCRAANCMFKSLLPCITCENFVTTVDYEPFFKQMITHIDEQLEDARYPHDREDLVTMKEVYVMFLIEIDRLKSQMSHE